MPRIYLDHNATTPLSAGAADAMRRWCVPGEVSNASSVHAEGRRARAAVSYAREQLAGAIGARAKDLVFTSGATEANRTVLDAFSGRTVISAVEHPSIAIQSSRPVTVSVCAVDRWGKLVVDDLRGKLEGAQLCSVMMANNEVGTLQPVQDVAALCRDAGVLFHVDASQALGRVPVNVNSLGADLVTLSSHKVHGPPGVGALWSRPGLDVPPLLPGGHQERGRRAGTENVIGIVGFGAAASEAAHRAQAMERVAVLRDRLADGLGAVWDTLRFSPTSDCLPNTLSIGFPPCDGETVLIALDLAGVSVSTGSACSAGSLEPSPVLLAMGYAPEVAATAIRFSLGVETTAEEIEATLEIVQRVVPSVAEELEWD